MRCENCCLEDGAGDALDLDAFTRKVSSCTECPYLTGQAPIPVSMLRRQISRLSDSARTIRKMQNRLRQFEHEKIEIMSEVQRSDQRIAKIEQAQKATALAAEIRIDEHVAQLRRQREAIVAMSTPIIQVWHGVLVVPLIGELDDTRMQSLTEQLLSALSTLQARYTVLDLTGVPSLDASSAQHVLRLSSAVRLLGADVLLCGMKPQVARTVTELGVDLGSLRARQTLKQALRGCITGRG